MRSHTLRASALPLAVLGCDASGAQPEPPQSDRVEVRDSNGQPPHWDGVHALTGPMECASTGGHPSGNIRQAAFGLPSVHGSHTLKGVLLTSIGVPASGGQTHAVDVWLTFGGGHHDDGHLIGTGNRMGPGAGTLTVERRGRGAVLRVEGTSNQGRTHSAAFECARVAVVQ